MDMGRRKLRVYGDADLEAELEDYLRNHKWINYEGARELGFSGRDDEHHYREASKRERVLVTHDEDFLNNAKFPLQETDGVIVIKRGGGLAAQLIALERFLSEVWPDFRDERGWRALGFFKARLTAQGFHWWGRTAEGKETEGYVLFL